MFLAPEFKTENISRAGLEQQGRSLILLGSIFLMQKRREDVREMGDGIARGHLLDDKSTFYFHCLLIGELQHEMITSNDIP